LLKCAVNKGRSPNIHILESHVPRREGPFFFGNIQLRAPPLAENRSLQLDQICFHTLFRIVFRVELGIEEEVG
jgi:hypothetical protein